MIGDCVSHYRIVEKLGAGGMGEVFAADDVILGRRVAIKFPSAETYDRTGRERFVAEARAASRLDHPNIARVYDYGEREDGRPFLVMEFVEGATLRDVLRQGPLPAPRAVEIVEDLLLALSHAHRHGLAHRDIKPGNVMITPDGQIKVLDFGLAKEIAAAKSIAASDVGTRSMGFSVAGVLRGTPEYMSPEQARGAAVDQRSDLFSAGVVLYECLTGRRPFSGSTNGEVLQRVLHVDPEPPSRFTRVPATLDRVAAKSLAKDPARRYQTAAEMLADLRIVEAGPRRRTLAAIVAVTIAVMAIAAFLFRARPYAPTAAAEEWYVRGAAALRDGTYYRAARSLERAVEADPGFALARARLAEARFELDDPDGARQELLRAIPSRWTRPPRGEDALYIQAAHSSLAGDYPSALAALQELLDRVPPREKTAVLVDLGRARERNGEEAKAIEAYRQAIALDGQNAAAHLRIAVLLGRMRKPEAAAEFAAADGLYRSLGNTEGQVEVALQRAVPASLSPRTLPDARAALEQAIPMSRAISTEYQEIAATLQLAIVTAMEGKAARGEELAAEALARARQGGMAYLEARGLVDLGQIQAARGNYDRAEQNLEEALAIARRRRQTRAEARALFALANLHQLRGAPAKALEEAEAALRFYDHGGYRIESTQSLTLMARAYRDLGRLGEALSAFERILTLAAPLDDRTTMARAESGIASVLEQQDRLPEALAHYDRSLEHARSAGTRPMQALALTSRGAVLARLGRLPEAGEALAEVPAIVNGQPPPALRTALLQSGALLASIRGANAQAATSARQVADDPNAKAPDRAWASCLAGVALARSGASRAGKELCAPAVATVEESERGPGLAALQVWLAEILLLDREPREAAQQIRPALDVYAGNGPEETGWRAWATAARIYRRMGDAVRASEATARASQRLAVLRSAWQPADVSSYLTRPDIRPLASEFQK